MSQTWEWATGSVPGVDHVVCGKPNQDACRIGFFRDGENEFLCGVVCDGCSESPGSGVGAAIVSQAIVNNLLTMRCQSDWTLAEPLSIFFKFFQIRLENVVRSALSVMGYMDDDLEYGVYAHFLCTVIGFWLDKDDVVIFGCGDGVWGVNGDVRVLGPHPGNQPPFFVYNSLLHSSIEPKQARVHLIRNFSANLVETLVIGSDGVGDLLEIGDRAFPGSDEPVGPVDDLWRDDRFYANKDGLRRHFFKAARTVTKLDRETGRVRRYNGLLPDDTTAIVVRRIKGEEGDDNAKGLCGQEQEAG